MAKLSVRRFADLGTAQAHYLAQVDAAAEAARGRIITAAPGQAMTYEAKHREAERYPDDPPHPWLEAEAAGLGTTPAEVAESVLLARQQWEALGVAIEVARLNAKTEIRAAATAAEMHAVLRAFHEEIDR